MAASQPSATSARSPLPILTPTPNYLPPTPNYPQPTPHYAPHAYPHPLAYATGPAFGQPSVPGHHSMPAPFGLALYPSLPELQHAGMPNGVTQQHAQPGVPGVWTPAGYSGTPGVGSGTNGRGV